MTAARNILRNRNTKESFAVDSLKLLPLNKQSIFTKKIDCSLVEEFIQYFIGQLSANVSEKDKEKIAIKLRQEYIGKNKEVDAMINNSQAFSTLITDCNKQLVNTGFDPNALSLSGFLKLLGTSLINAKLNTIFPGLFLLTSQVTAVATQSYTYHQGQPMCGENLCAALHNCIQGYLTEIGQTWQKDMPQIARVVEHKASHINNCVAQNELEAMLARAYRGPNEDAANCTLHATTNNGGILAVHATQVDPITCDIMQDSLVGFAEQCPIPTNKNSDLLYLSLGIGLGGAASLALLALGLSLYCRHRRQEAALINEERQFLNPYAKV